MLNETNQTQKQNKTKPCPMSYFTCEIQDVSTCVHMSVCINMHICECISMYKCVCVCVCYKKLEGRLHRKRKGTSWREESQ